MGTEPGARQGMNLGRQHTWSTINLYSISFQLPCLRFNQQNVQAPSSQSPFLILLLKKLLTGILWIYPGTFHHFYYAVLSPNDLLSWAAGNAEVSCVMKQAWNWLCFPPPILLPNETRCIYWIRVFQIVRMQWLPCGHIVYLYPSFPSLSSD